MLLLEDLSPIVQALSDGCSVQQGSLIWRTLYPDSLQKRDIRDRVGIHQEVGADFGPDLKRWDRKTRNLGTLYKFFILI